MKSLLLALLLFPLAVTAAPDDEWAAIVALDAGPGGHPKTREEALTAATRHFVRHKALIETFIARYPQDSRVFDARLRLAAILAATGNMNRQQQPVDEAMRLLAELEKAPGVPLEKRADAGFRRVSLYLQSMRGRELEMRDSIVDSARNFVARYPGDRRGPRLLVEVATVCDNDPQLKRSLLLDAKALSSEPSLNHRIADDLVRLSLLDKPIRIQFATQQGGTFDSAVEKGKIVLVVFWSAESPHCLMWFPKFRQAMSQFPGRVVVATVALDSNKKEFATRLQELGLADWPAHFDGAGWDNAVARPLGINALPTVFLIDQSGVLRSINARDSYDFWIRRLLRG